MIKAAVMSDLAAAKHQLRKSKSLLQMDQLKCMKRVLRRLGYCNASDVIEIKENILILRQFNEKYNKYISISLKLRLKASKIFR